MRRRSPSDGEVVKAGCSRGDNFMHRRSFLAAMAAPAAALSSGVAIAQGWPQRPIRFVVPFAAGGPDTAARVIGQQMSTRLGQPVIVDNRAGANGVIGADAVARSSPDGYTILFTSASFAVNPSIYRKLPYDPLRDFTCIGAPTTAEGLILVVSPKLPARNLAELLALGRRPGATMSYGSPGTGNTLHLASALFNVKAGMNMVHVPYKGAGPALTGLMAGDVDMMFVAPTGSLQHIHEGRLRAIAFSGAKRLAQMPDLPTVAEAGLPGYAFDGGWYGMFAPAATPRDIVERLTREMRATVADPRVKASLAAMGVVPAGLGGGEFRAVLEKDIRTYAEIVKLAAIQPE